MKKVEFEGNKNIISKKLKEVRCPKGISQQELAAKLQIMNINIDQQMVSKIEKNMRQVTDYELFAISKCFGVKPEDLAEYKFD